MPCAATLWKRPVLSSVLALLILTLLACGGSSNEAGDALPDPSPPEIVSFSAVPEVIAAGSGNTARLSWEVSGATRLTISPDVGDLAGAAGATTVQPSVTTQYTLLAENDQGSDVALLTVTVESTETTSAAAYGDIPAGLPPRLAVGLMEEPDETWMRDSGVAWDMRYHYFTKGWRDNWGWDPGNNGSWGLRWMESCDANGFLPAIQYYCMNEEPGGGEDQFYNKTRSSDTMASYFDDFKVLMERAREFDKPVLVLLEADGFAYMQRQSNEDPNAYAAIADSGMSELGDLPNSVAGWGLAFLEIRRSVGANKVILGMHISSWATGNDISYYQTDVLLQPEVDQAYAFLAELGLEDNITGTTYDLLVGDPLDRDSGYYTVVHNQDQDRWWNADDDAPIDTRSFNRYAEWLKLWNRKAGKRWVLWQIPLGNSNHLNVANTGGPREGYQDNRAEYFFKGDTTHLQKFADVGTIALLFGPGAGGQSYYTNDVYTDGSLFMKNHAGAFLNAGGLPIEVIGR